MKYLTKQGIAKKKAGSIVVLDFIHSGKSLDLVMRMLEERGDIPEGRLYEHSLIHDLADITKKYPHPHVNKELAINFHNDLMYSRFHNLSNVPHFTFNGGDCYKCKDTTIDSTGKRITEVFREFDEFSLPDARAWALCSTHEAMKILNRI